MPSKPSPPTALKRASPEQLLWLRSPAGQWSRVEQAFFAALGEGRLEEDASALGLEPDDLVFPKGKPEQLLRQFRRANPDLDPARPPKDEYQLALGVLRMLSLENPD